MITVAIIIRMVIATAFTKAAYPPLGSKLRGKSMSPNSKSFSPTWTQKIYTGQKVKPPDPGIFNWNIEAL